MSHCTEAKQQFANHRVEQSSEEEELNEELAKPLNPV